MKLRKLIFFAAAAGSAWAGLRFIYYGSIFRSCVYTERASLPDGELVGGKIVLFKNAFLAVGKDPEYGCLPGLGTVNLELIGPEIISNVTVGKAYFERQGRAVSSINAGSKEFQVKKIFAVRKHGITTVDSGSGPLTVLLLRDSQGTEYKVATVLTGLNADNRFLKLVTTTSETILSPSYFE